MSWSQCLATLWSFWWHPLKCEIRTSFCRDSGIDDNYLGLGSCMCSVELEEISAIKWYASLHLFFNTTPVYIMRFFNLLWHNHRTHVFKDAFVLMSFGSIYHPRTFIPMWNHPSTNMMLGWYWLPHTHSHQVSISKSFYNLIIVK